MNPTTCQDYSRASVRNGFYLDRQFFITASPGAGKTTLAQGIATAFTPNLEHISAGKIMRTRATALAMSVDQFAAHMRMHPDAGHDNWIDREIAEASIRNGIVFDSHLAPIFAPHTFGIKLVCPLKVRAQRRAKSCGADPEIVAQELDERERNDDTRYASLYPGSSWPDKDFDLVIDTSLNDEAACLGLVLATHAQWLLANERTLVRLDRMPQYQPE